jgi:AraC-like DNA-binding protein
MEKWTVEEINVLEKYYKGNPKKCKKLLPNRTMVAISQKAFKLGISTLWTEEEDARLIKLSERHTRSKLAKLMGRSPNAISNRRVVLGIQPFQSTTDMYNFTEVAEMLGLNHSTISKIWVKNGLKYKKIGYRNYVKEDEMLRYVQEHPDCYDARKADYYIFCRYKWFLDKLEADRKKSLKHGTRWTDHEKSRADMLKKRGLTYLEIAEELGRTRKAVVHHFATR